MGGAHEALWFGTGCLFRNASRCYPAGHKYYDVTNFGLNRLLNQVGVCCCLLLGLQDMLQRTSSARSGQMQGLVPHLPGPLP